MLVTSRIMAAVKNRWRALLAFPRRPPELAVRIGYNGLAQVAGVLVVLALTPLLLSRLGLDRFGIWSLALVVLNTLRLLDGGIAGSMARFYAIHAAGDERVEAGRLLVGSLLALALIGLLFSALMLPLAPEIVGLLNIPDHLHGEAIVTLRLVPALAAVALMGESTSALLVGHGRFKALAGTTWASAGAFAAGVVLLVGPGSHLEALMLVTGARFALLTAANLVAGARHISIGWPFVPTFATAREVGKFSSWMQLTAAVGFVNVQLDGLVIAAILPVRYVGLYQIGFQVASAVRSLPLYAFPPLLTRLTTIFRLEGSARVALEFERLESRWLPDVLGHGLVAVAAVGFSIVAWLGDGYVLSGATAAVLLAAYVLHVGLTGMRTCYVRAIGKPSLETRSSIAWSLINLVITVPLVLWLGLLGAVASTAISGMIASVYFISLCRAREGLPIVRPDRRWLTIAAIAVVITIAGELAILQTGYHGFLALLLSGVPALLGWALIATRLRQGTEPAPVSRRAPARP
jgi:O-antigen/teichoic acid export membrane protein